MTRRRPASATRKMQLRYLVDRMQQVEWDLHQPIVDRWAIPPAWKDLAARTPRREKVRITIRVEEDVVKFFKSLGAGYQVKMNEVLASFMHAKLAGLLVDEDAIGEYAREAALKARPELGDTDRFYDKVQAVVDEY
ncbi:BrnA antitoxin family protein [Maritimibacter sp. UBA3975]|uniref:BrnA antitoxin family protein n=1 Tax=Maritimibacter sp. UBA3975 TaxID=1946833 RepID=UPI0025C2CAD8|nr:BrnA antitoxin family protein [Maritimibacter sp. UBA3975]|tara:strand:- start:2267 stop:2674 length:408 start_codon:yes stop_codon:yes gene_type:complete